MGPDIQEHDETRLANLIQAPGSPGAKASWDTGAKTAVGTAVNAESRVWFTIANGYINEVYFPDVDRANTRFLRFVVAGQDGFFSDEATDADHSVRATEAGIPLFSIISQCKRRRYRLEKTIVTDPERDALVLSVQFEPAPGSESLDLYVFADPQMGDRGECNDGWAGEYKGIPMLFASRNGVFVAVACSTGFELMHCGYLGTSDGIAQLQTSGRITENYTAASEGNVALLGRIDWRQHGGAFRICLAFGGRAAEAGLQARASLLRDFEEICGHYREGWNDYHASLTEFAKSDELLKISAAVCRTHESKRFPGAFVASLSTPWGFARGDKATGGYHVIWPRDLCETVTGLLSCGDADSGRRGLFYLECTQDADGHWNQNQWLDGSKHWTSRQMDETSVPLLLGDVLHRCGELGHHDPWPMVKKTAAYLVQNGPVAEEDRWESIGGYAVFTMAVEVAALLAAADFADRKNEPAMAAFLRGTADAWNEAIDELTYVSGTDLAHKVGVSGYYVRIMPPEAILGEPLTSLTIKLTNHPKGEQTRYAASIVSPDALALVRYGLRAADDSRILNTVRIIDSTLKIQTATGPVWRRYTDDGYGEHADGAPFNKQGIGRGWPLLAGERAHFEIARGNFDFAEELRRTIQRQTSPCGLIPEQIWDAPDIPERGLYNGHPTGSGMPLVWAHAEYLKLVRSLRDGRVWNIPPQTTQRYVDGRTQAKYQIWTRTQQRRRMRTGKDLRIDCARPAVVEWTVDDWASTRQMPTRDSGLGVHFAVLPVQDNGPETRIRFRLAKPNREDVSAHEFQVVVH